MEKTNSFNTKFGFILASVGSAVGMGNIWLFPYRVGAYGGAAFLIPYFIFVVLFGITGLSGEFALGRLTGTGPVGAYDYACKTRGMRFGKLLGAIPLMGSMGIAIGYAVIVGWVLRSIGGSLSGAMLTGDPAEFFAAGTGAFGSIPWHIIAIVSAVAVLIFGITGGIEKISKFMMPAFFVLFIIIAIRVAFLPGAMEGYKYLLVPKWEFLLNPETWIMAMGQAFFSLSITGSGMIIYGSYLKKGEDIPFSAGMTALLDTLAALLSGFAVIPAVFAFGMDPAAGPPLMFITLPKVFMQMPFGRLFATIFFVSVFFAGITSLINMFEVLTEAGQRHLKLKRTVSAILVGAVAFAVGIFIEFEPFLGKWMDAITIYIVPFGALLGAFIIFWVLGTDKIVEELNNGRKKPLGKVFKFFAKYVYVCLAVVVLIMSIIFKGIG